MKRSQNGFITLNFIYIDSLTPGVNIIIVTQLIYQLYFLERQNGKINIKITTIETHAKN